MNKYQLYRLTEDCYIILYTSSVFDSLNEEDFQNICQKLDLEEFKGYIILDFIFKCGIINDRFLISKYNGEDISIIEKNDNFINFIYNDDNYLEFVKYYLNEFLLLNDKNNLGLNDLEIKFLSEELNNI